MGGAVKNKKDMAEIATPSARNDGGDKTALKDKRQDSSTSVGMTKVNRGRNDIRGGRNDQ